MKKGFFAFSNDIASSNEAIRLAVLELEKSRIALITPWNKVINVGQQIVKEIFGLIDNSDFFCADLTGLNENVLLEIGYAIAKEKPVFLILDTSYSDSLNLFKELNLLETIGYISYTNSTQIVKGIASFLNEEKKPLISEILNSVNHSSSKAPLFYVKSQHYTDYTKTISHIISKIPTIIDDSNETKVSNFTWYIENTYLSPYCLIEFSTNNRSGFKLHNSKCSLISGLCLGFGKNTLLVCEKPHDTIFDLRELLQKYITLKECEKIVGPFIENISNNIAEIIFNKNQKRRVEKARTELQNIDFGEMIAEHENDQLYNYYVETGHIDSFIKNEYNIIIGRKGTGKTASLVFLTEYLRSDKRNYVVVIKPVNFEIDGIISLLSNLEEDYEKSFVIESVWKFLIYTEIARTLYFDLKSKPLYSKTEKDDVFIGFIEKNSKIYLEDLSVRLESQIELVKQGAFNTKDFSQNEFRKNISEILHINTFHDLRNNIADLIEEKNSIIVLIDNLDKSWRSSSNLDILSRYILGLLGVSGRLAHEMSVVKSRQKNIKFRLAIFLRSDIFRYIIKYAREPDKLEYTKLIWVDPEVFFRIIEERFIQLNNSVVNPEDFWNKYIISEVNGMDVKSFIMSVVYPRPRDVIYFFKKAQEIAIMRGHTKINENDLLDAYKNYSSWVFTSLIVENGISFNQMENFLYCLIGSRKEILLDEIKEFMISAEIDPNVVSPEEFSSHLVRLSILGREVSEGIFNFEYDFEESIKFFALSKKLNSNKFKIHPALYPFLEIS
jgi:Cdc6-like AAA superfamily ATPase